VKFGLYNMYCMYCLLVGLSPEDVEATGKSFYSDTWKGLHCDSLLSKKQP